MLLCAALWSLVLSLQPPLLVYQLQIWGICLVGVGWELHLVVCRCIRYMWPPSLAARPVYSSWGACGTSCGCRTCLLEPQSCVWETRPLPLAASLVCEIAVAAMGVPAAVFSDVAAMSVLVAGSFPVGFCHGWSGCSRCSCLYLPASSFLNS